MAFTAGTRLGPYEIVAPIGSGGMGEVYRARDLKLNRDVAIKVLPERLAGDPERLARLEREAQLLAALNHPHIAHIHGFEESSGTPALVMELVEGPTLAEHMATRRMSVAEALAIAVQVAEALEAAHERGIVHRDLKPANIKVAQNDQVKVLDFGLAKVASSDVPGPDLSLVTMSATEAGMVLGTAAYMSPEQARGRPVDKRTDIWAFGCVLFEMLSGERAFPGDTMSDTIASVLIHQPDWSRLPVNTPSVVRRLLRHCLEKDLQRRFRDIGDARVELEDPESDRGGEITGRDSRRVTRRTALTALAGATAGAAAAAAFAFNRNRGASPRSLTRFALKLNEGDLFNPSFNKRVSVSPDGTYVACNAAVRGGGAQLFVRSLRQLQFEKLDGVTSGVPFFSPDSRWLGYIATSGTPQLRKVALSGGAPTTISTNAFPGIAGATWADSETIYFVPDSPAGIAAVPATGGQASEVAKIDFDSGERLHKFPYALPGGRGLLFTVATADAESFDDARIAAIALDTGKRTMLVEGGTSACFVPPGYLVYARNSNLLAVRFDPQRLEVTGDPFTVLEGVLMSRNTGVANFDVSTNGDLVYIPGKADGGSRTLYWVDRNGRAEKLPLPARSYLRPRLSPDSRKLAIEIEGSSHDVYVYDFASGVLSNITTDGVSHWPVWSPDGKYIGYRSGQMGRFRLWQVPADRSGPAQQVVAAGYSQSAESYAPDGKAIAYTVADPGGPPKVAVVPLDGDRKPQPLDDTKFAQGSPKFSPDGRWLAYCSNESGRPQVYVQAFPGPGAKTQISNDGGTDPVWRRNGGELFYRNGDRMMAVAIATSPNFSAGRPQELWTGHYSPGMSSSCGAPGLTSSNYDVTADGSRFLMIKDDDQDTSVATEIIVVLGWQEELRRLASA